MTLHRKSIHEGCDNEVRVLQKRITELEEWQRKEIENRREIIATLDLVKKLLLGGDR